MGEHNPVLTVTGAFNGYRLAFIGGATDETIVTFKGDLSDADLLAAANAARQAATLATQRLAVIFRGCDGAVA